MMMVSKSTTRLPTSRTAHSGGRRGLPFPGRIGRTAIMLAAACFALAVLPGPAEAIQILEASDHAELEAVVSATGVSRVALANDRIRRVVRSPGGFDVEHDAASGDLYLRPADDPGPALDGTPADPLPVTLFLGSEQGFTYRLTLTPDTRPTAQVLIRNAAAAAEPAVQAPNGAARDARVAELVRLVRAATRRELLPGYVVGPGRAGPDTGLPTIESWRGLRFTAHVLAARPAVDARALAGRFGPGVAAVWIASPAESAVRRRIAVVVTEPDRIGAAR